MRGEEGDQLGDPRHLSLGVPEAPRGTKCGGRAWAAVDGWEARHAARDGKGAARELLHELFRLPASHAEGDDRGVPASWGEHLYPWQVAHGGVELGGEALGTICGPRQTNLHREPARRSGSPRK